MKTIKLTLAAKGMTNIVCVPSGDALPDGTVATIADEYADMLVAREFAVFVDGSSAIKARKEAEAAEAERKIEEQHARAKNNMHGFDDLPPKVRQALNEDGPMAMDAYNDTLPNDLPGTEAADVFADIMPEETTSYPAKKKRGRPKKETQPE